MATCLIYFYIDRICCIKNSFVEKFCLLWAKFQILVKSPKLVCDSHAKDADKVKPHFFTSFIVAYPANRAVSVFISINPLWQNTKQLHPYNINFKASFESNLLLQLLICYQLPIVSRMIARRRFFGFGVKLKRLRLILFSSLPQTFNYARCLSYGHFEFFMCLSH